MMSEKLIDKAALEMYRRSRRIGGVKRPAADEEWRELGPKGRKMWRELAQVAYEAITGKSPIPTATVPTKPAARSSVFKPF